MLVRPIYEYMIFLTMPLSATQQAVNAVEGDLFSHMFGNYASRKQTRLRRLCRLEPPAARSEFLGLQYLARLYQARDACLECAPTSDTRSTLSMIKSDIKQAESLPSLKNARNALNDSKPFEVLEKRCIAEWTAAEANIRVRRSPMPLKVFDLPPMLSLREPRHRLLSVHWLFHRFPRDPSSLKKLHPVLGEQLLDTLHRLLTSNPLNKTAMSLLGKTIDTLTTIVPYRHARPKNTNAPPPQ